MAHHVYANGNEIASKSASGSAKAAFPDVCFSPPTPPATGVPVPYPNTCLARDISNGSRTVLIAGMQIALEDKSYFATSYGNEPATPGLKKGVRSGKIKGKCFFKSWSPNVKVEGKCVDRHMDIVTHNHSNPANALTQRYLAVWDKAEPCKKDKEAVEKNCKEKKPSTKKPRKGILQKLENLASIPDEMAQKALLYKRRPGVNGWVEDYCDGLWIKPMKGGPGKETLFDKAQKDINAFLSQDKLTMSYNAFMDMLKLAKEQFGIVYVFRKAGGLAARSLLKNVVGGAAATTGIGTVVTAGMAAWTAYDFVSTATQIAKDLGPVGAQILSEIKSLDQLEQALKQRLKEWKEQPSKLMADLMSAKAASDACIRARKCKLVAYEKTDPLESARSGDGCCPGQTGHHVMPGSMLGRKSDGSTDPDFENPCASSYDHDNAPTMCLEGANNTHGSHGAAHTALGIEVKTYQAKQKAAGGTPGRIPYREAREASLRAIKTVAPWCDIKCLRAQLDSYYKDCDKGNEKNLKSSYGGGRAKLPTPSTGPTGPIR